MLRKLLTAGALALACLPAQAGLMYRWETISPGNRIQDATGFLEFASGVRVGDTVSFNWVPPSTDCFLDGLPPNCSADPSSPINRFYFIPNTEDPRQSGVNQFPRTTGQGATPRSVTPVSLAVSFFLAPNGLLTAPSSALPGSLRATSSASSDVNLIGAFDGTWLMLRYASDGGTQCFRDNDPCVGLVGRFVLDVGKVPEPGTLALLAGGLLAAGLRRRGDARRSSGTATARHVGQILAVS